MRLDSAKKKGSLGLPLQVPRCRGPEMRGLRAGPPCRETSVAVQPRQGMRGAVAGFSDRVQRRFALAAVASAAAAFTSLVLVANFWRNFSTRPASTTRVCAPV